ncbi:hypothetical protein IFM89_023667 [Coptis chinensis]|uniref:Uncharacterized protein n=1 Tax=Coptis chinensis TaxID=261450 RepID=A0A835HXJ7_9MAGN|nr:hypothetical protein IFM89_023667 [Coptis chinensis]
MVGGSKTSIILMALVLLLQVFYAISSINFDEVVQPCNGSIAECNEEDGLLMDSEISRRILAAQGYAHFITYPPLKADSACSNGARGDPYHCAPRRANNYRPGCSHYYGCK